MLPRFVFYNLSEYGVIMSTLPLMNSLIIAAVFLAIGWTAGWLVASFRKTRGTREEQTETREDTPSGEEEFAMWIGGRKITQADQLSVQEKELIRRKIDGLLSDGDAITDRPERQAVLESLSEPPRTQRVRTVPLAENASSPHPWQNLNGDLLKGKTLELGEKGVETVKMQETTTPDWRNTQPRQIKKEAPTVQLNREEAEGEKTTEAPKTIVQQINEILQDKMQSPPEGVPGTITILEDQRKGILVRAGNAEFEGISALPEGPVKVLLRSCVHEWERRQMLRRENR